MKMLKPGITSLDIDRSRPFPPKSCASLEEIKKYRSQLEAWEKFCKQMGDQPADVALAWLLANPAVTAPIIGPRTLEQLTGSLRALKIKFSKAEMKKLNEIWPGPGGEAPEAYAW